MVLTFDTQQIYRSLSGKGNFTDEQAETLTDALKEVASLNIKHLASKDDLGALRAELEGVETVIRSDMASMEASLRSDTDAMKSSLQSEIALLRKDLVALEQRLTIKLGGMMVVGVGVIVAFKELFGG